MTMNKTNTTAYDIDRLSQKIMAATGEEEEEVIRQYMWVILDDSASLKKLEDVVYEQTQCILKGIVHANKASVDVQTSVKLALFNSEIQEFNSTHLDPGQLADTFTREEYRCRGTTSASAVYNYIDKELSRSNPVVRNLKKHSSGFIFTIITDAEVNDEAGLRKQARQILDSNRFYTDYCKVLVVYLGDEKHKSTAVALANGHEDCVITLEDDLTALLSPVIIQSTVTFGDGTHVNSTGERTLGDLAEEAKERNAQGTRSADDMTDAELIKMFSDLMGNT